MKFKYNERIYNPVNIEKKLKKLGITINDIEIISKEEEIVEYNDTKLYHFINRKTGEIISSIYNDLNNLKNVICINDYERLYN